MDCYTLSAGAASHIHRAGSAVVHHVGGFASRHVGQAIRRVRHPLAHAGAAHPAGPQSMVITRVACKPAAGFLPGLAKAAGIAAVGGAVLGSPTRLPDVAPPVPAMTAPAPGLGGPGQTGPLAFGAPAFPGNARTRPPPATIPQISVLPPALLISPGPGPGTDFPPPDLPVAPGGDVPVPEPPSVMMFGAALLATLLLRRRRPRYSAASANPPDWRRHIRA